MDDLAQRARDRARRSRFVLIMQWQPPGQSQNEAAGARPWRECGRHAVGRSSWRGADGTGVLIAGGGLAGCLAALATGAAPPGRAAADRRGEATRFGGDGFAAICPTPSSTARRARRWRRSPASAGPASTSPFRASSRKLKASLCAASTPDALHRAMIATLEPEAISARHQGGRGARGRAGAGRRRDDARPRARSTRAARPICRCSICSTRRGSSATDPLRRRRTGLDRPLLVDATVEQTGGFSFIQCLPGRRGSAARRRRAAFPSAPQPDEAAGARLDSYLASRGWRTAEVEAEGASVAAAADRRRFRRLLADRRRAGRQDRAARRLRPAGDRPHRRRRRPQRRCCSPSRRTFGGAALHDLFEGEAKKLWKQRELERGINAALAGTAPDRRRAVYERLYRLDAGAILGFLAGRPGLLDRRRIQQAIKA